MLTRTIVQLLCLLLAWTTVFPAYAAIPVRASLSAQDIATLQQHDPNVRVIHVSPEQYPALRAKLLREGYRPAGGLQPVAQYQLSQNSPNPTQTPETTAPTESTPLPSEADLDCKQRKSTGNQVDTGDVTPPPPDPNNPAGWFIVIGVAFVVLWVLVVVNFIDSMEPCSGRWSELSATASNMLAGTNQYAHFYGVRYMQGFDKWGTDFGVSAELGQADILLTQVSSLHLQGLYWLLGPMLRWNMTPGGTPSYFQLQFLAGSTANPQMGIIAQVKAGLDFAIGSNFRWGLDLGAMNIKLHANQGIITNLSQSYLVYGLNVGYRF